jgi:hypothetical protein
MQTDITIVDSNIYYEVQANVHFAVEDRSVVRIETQQGV